ncbi:hypothetical protein B0H11DRAFT_2247505 [Mycena galericulata]|nr:hypothetical protein B0H11DRAFT_2247505 [Mycena galericulata]
MPHVLLLNFWGQPRHYGPASTWNTVKHKNRRSLNSVILPDGVVADLVRNAKEFISTERWDWKNVDDSFLQRAASSIPKDSIFLIEDIDCAFVSRSDEDHREEIHGAGGRGPLGHATGAHGPRSLVTLSGFLNVIDGVGSEEGRLFFATTNHIDRLDPALLRPGRIDCKVAYGLATRDQARSLFMHFFRFLSIGKDEAVNTTTLKAVIGNLATNFSLRIPPAEFSTAELQRYLQGHKTTPMAAVDGVPGWVAEQRMERNARERE